MAPKTALALDVDSRAATKAGRSPHEVAPPIEPDGQYAAAPDEGLPDGRRWFPGRRHDGKTNVALLDGSVLSERDRLASSNSINWADARYAGKWVNGVYEDDTELGRVMLQSYWPDDALSPTDAH
jgi:prepilin-type processing-associated H-X9-DG protein